MTPLTGPGRFSLWIQEYSVTMIKAACRIYDDGGQHALIFPDDPEFSYAVAVDILVEYARHLETLSNDINRLTV